MVYSKVTALGANREIFHYTRTVDGTYAKSVLVAFFEIFHLSLKFNLCASEFHIGL